MGEKFAHWDIRSTAPVADLIDLKNVLLANRAFRAVEKLDYGDHGLEVIASRMAAAMREGKKIALYADYDVDGTMSCISWIWFFKAVGYRNYVHYIPCRFSEGYGVNIQAIRKLVEEGGADVVITMDTGITANEEAAWCRERGVEFVCTDHHKIQPERMPDSLILNPKLHPDAEYQELCGCGITFVLLRKLAQLYPEGDLRQGDKASAVWNDLLGLAGMATICDVVPLNGVNHTLARMGVHALMRSQRPVLKALREAASVDGQGDEKDIGFRLGPRINAVGRLEHADVVVSAFVGDDPVPLVRQMGLCNERRKLIQAQILEEARKRAQAAGDAPILFLGGDWHPGVVGIAASKIAEEFWRPTWLFQIKDGLCKGSSRSIRGFDVTNAMSSAGKLFTRFGGHAAAGGFTFPAEREAEIRRALTAYAEQIRQEQPNTWVSSISVDCVVPPDLASMDLLEVFDSMKPFGHGFEEPRFLLDYQVESVRFLNDKKTGQPRHTAVSVLSPHGPQKVMFFNEVLQHLRAGKSARFVVTASRNVWRGQANLSLMGHDWEQGH